MRVRVRAPAKVNLWLLLGGLRDDGRHEVATLIESVSLADELTLTEAGRDEVICPGVEEPNIVTRALAGLRARGWNGPPVRIEVSKRIPIAGGMGGGSADAAAVLRLAPAVAHVSDHVLVELAAELGSDVPSQLRPGLVLGTGAGERVARREPLAEHALVILPLPHRLSTADVYAEADRLELCRPAEELTEPDTFVNDLERAAISLCPEIEDALSAVRQTGADPAMVSGSGPTVFGLFWGPDAVRRAQAAADYLPAAKCAVPVDAEFGRPDFSAQSGEHR